MNERLVAFLYLLLRDALPAGEIERLVLEAEKTNNCSAFSAVDARA